MVRLTDNRETILTTQDSLFDVRPCLRDPVFALLKDRWRLSPITGAGLFLILYLGGGFLFSWISGTAFPRPGLDRPFVWATANLILYTVIIPLGAVLAMRFYNQTEVTFERLHTDGVVGAPLEEYNRFLERLHRRYNAAGLHFLAFGVALLVAGYQIHDATHENITSWGNWGTGAAGMYHLVMNVIAWYVAILIGCKTVITAQAMQQVFDCEVNIQPFHPDGCGGLRLLTDISVTIALFAALGAMGVILFVAFGRPLFSVPVLVAVVVLTLTPLVFATCLHRAHQVMRNVKEALLWQINRQVQPSYQKLCERLAQGEVMSDATAEVLRLEELHAFARRLPVWPTNTQVMTQVLLSVAVPFVLLILQFILGNLVRK